MWQHDHLSVSLSVISCNQKRAETCSFVFSIINRAAASVISALTIYPPTGIHTASSNFNVFLSLTSGHHHPTHSGHPHIFNKSSSSFQLNFFSSFSIWLILRNSLLHCKWGIIQISNDLHFKKNSPSENWEAAAFLLGKIFKGRKITSDMLYYSAMKWLTKLALKCLWLGLKATFPLRQGTSCLPQYYCLNLAEH